MTIRHVIELETVLYVTAAALISGVLVLSNNRASLPVLLENAPQIVTPIPVTPKVEKASQISPDGTKNLAMTITTEKNDFSTYSFMTTDSSGANKTEIYSATVPSSEKYSLPFNAWSPDNKYLFIYRQDKDAMVFRSDGKLIAGEQYIDLENVLKTKNNTNTLKGATGWADPSLIIFNMENKGGQTASYWLEIPSKAVIPLSNQF